MVSNTWYQYNSAWYYLGPDGAMCQSQLDEISGKIYAVDADGKMITDPINAHAGSGRGAAVFRGGQVNYIGGCGIRH